jgi:cell division septal protein FtsQ
MTKELEQNESEATTTSREAVPRPTYAPAAMAMAVMMLFWGILTHWTMSVGGGCLMIWALWSRVGEFRHAWKEEP